MVKMENNKVKRTNNHQYLECKMHLLIETSAVSSNEYIYTYSNIIIIHHWCTDADLFLVTNKLKLNVIRPELGYSFVCNAPN